MTRIIRELVSKLSHILLLPETAYQTRAEEIRMFDFLISYDHDVSCLELKSFHKAQALGAKTAPCLKRSRAVTIIFSLLLDISNRPGTHE